MLCEYFAGLNHNERIIFRQLQGADGQLTGTRMVQEAVNKKFPQYSPDGLDDWVARRVANTNEQARSLAKDIELILQSTIIEMLKEEFNTDPMQWWFDGVPKEVRKKVDIQINESDGKTGTREQNFNLIHYREIIVHNWHLFKETFSYQGAGKDKGTSWINEVNSIRNPVSHASRQYKKKGSLVSFEQIAKMQQYLEWLEKQVENRNSSPISIDFT